MSCTTDPQEAGTADVERARPFSVGFALDEAEVFRQARQGEPTHMANLALLHHEEGHHDVERVWLEKAAAVGGVVAMARLGRLLISEGDEEQGRALVAAVLTGGEAAGIQDFLDVGIDLACFGDSEGARAWWYRAAKWGENNAMRLLYTLALFEEDWISHEHWLHRAALAGDVDAMVLVADRLDANGFQEDAWLWRLAGGGSGRPRVVVDDLGLPRGYRFPPAPQPPRPLHDPVDVHCSHQVRWGCTRVKRHEYTLQLTMSEMREHTHHPFPQEGEATSSR